jgi:hypothetical protein
MEEQEEEETIREWARVDGRQRRRYACDVPV